MRDELSVRAKNVLSELAVSTPQELASFTANEVVRANRGKPEVLVELRSWLAADGLSFKGDEGKTESKPMLLEHVAEMRKLQSELKACATSIERILLRLKVITNIYGNTEE